VQNAKKRAVLAIHLAFCILNFELSFPWSASSDIIGRSKVAHGLPPRAGALNAEPSAVLCR
jgi:hypothetical protein